MVGNIVKAVSDLLTGTVGKVIPDKDLQKKLEAELNLRLLDEVPQIIRAELMAKKEVLLAEIGGESWLQRNWRPILMLTVVFIVANNYIFAPYLSLFTDSVLVLELPEKLWNLMMVGVGGYVVGRSGEKITKTIYRGE